MEIEKFLFAGVSVFGLIFVLGCSFSKNNLDSSVVKKQSPFSFSINKHPETGWNIVTLKYVHSQDSRLNKQVKIAPEVGDNLFSIQYGKSELLYGPNPMKDLVRQGCGIKMLYPTPNRVKNAELRFEDVMLKFPPNNGLHFIHGLVKDIAWEYAEPIVTEKDITFKTWIFFNDLQSFYSLFPYKHRIGLDFILSTEGIAFRYHVENQDSKRLPFGFAIHPYFKILGERKNVFVKIPAKNRMEAVEKIPTGKLLPLDVDSAVDLRKFTSIENLNLDDVFWGMKSKNPAVVQYRDKNIQLTFKATDDFTHGVLFTPQNNFFCFENQTSSTDAHNLYSNGYKEESHLQIVEPGHSAKGTVKIVIMPVRN